MARLPMVPFGVTCGRVPCLVRSLTQDGLRTKMYFLVLCWVVSRHIFRGKRNLSLGIRENAGLTVQ